MDKSLLLFFIICFSVPFGYSQTTEEFNSSPTFIEYPGVPQWKTTAEVSINGVEYELTGIINGSWAFSNYGGVGNSSSLYAESAGDLSVTIKRKDGQNFQFYGIWLKYTNFETYPSPYLTVSYNGSGEANEVYGLSSTVNLNKDINVSSVSLRFSGLWKLNVDNLIVGSSAVPPTVITASPSEITPNSASLGGEITNDGGSLVSERGVVWSTSSNSNISDNKIQMGSGSGKFSGVVNNLPSNTTIYSRAYAINGEGVSYGNENIFKTLAPQLKNFSWSADNLFAGATGVTYTFSYTTVSQVGAPYDMILYALQSNSLNGYGWNTSGLTIDDVSVTIDGVPVTLSENTFFTSSGSSAGIRLASAVPGDSDVVVTMRNVTNNSTPGNYSWNYLRTAYGSGQQIDDALNPEPIVLTAPPPPAVTGAITITNDPSDPASDWLLSDGKLIPLVDGAQVNVNEVTNALASGDLIVEAETDVFIDASVTPTLAAARSLTLKAGSNVILSPSSQISATGDKLN
ncbi:MAG TPA: hypothetical protein VK941_07720, partial [Gillisia sp.]|nr:hypothetical protein [Gillisia sp.]